VGGDASMNAFANLDFERTHYVVRAFGGGG
jgi:hypothetical protein